MKSPWEELDEIARRHASGSGEISESLSRIAVLLRDHIERVGLRHEQAETVPPLALGAEVELLVRVRARVHEMVIDETGSSYELMLETRNFQGGRVVAIDHDEIVSASPIDVGGIRYG